MQIDEAMTYAEAATSLGLSKGRVRQLVAAGTLPPVEVPGGHRLVPRAAVAALAAERRKALAARLEQLTPAC